MEIFFNLVLLIVGLIGLIKASDVFVDAASSLAIKLRVPKMLIALTIAAFGTCAPELAISFNSIADANYDMTLANVIGSCIVNILLIVGIATLVKPIKVHEQTVKKRVANFSPDHVRLLCIVKRSHFSQSAKWFISR